jgi:hypothetical protein
VTRKCAPHNASSNVNNDRHINIAASLSLFTYAPPPPPPSPQPLITSLPHRLTPPSPHLKFPSPAPSPPPSPHLTSTTFPTSSTDAFMAEAPARFAVYSHPHQNRSGCLCGDVSTTRDTAVGYGHGHISLRCFHWWNRGGAARRALANSVWYDHRHTLSVDPADLLVCNHGWFHSRDFRFPVGGPILVIVW